MRLLSSCGAPIEGFLRYLALRRYFKLPDIRPLVRIIVNHEQQAFHDILTLTNLFHKTDFENLSSSLKGTVPEDYVVVGYVFC